MKCRFCGKRIKKGSNVCDSCGKEVTEGLNTDELIDAMPQLHDDFDKINQLQAKEKKKKAKKEMRRENKGKRWKIAIAIILVVAILAGVVTGTLFYMGILGEEKVEAPTTSAIEGGLQKTFAGYLFTDALITDEATAKAAIAEAKSVLSFTDVENEFEFDKKIVVGGDTFYRFRQIYQGIPVYGGEVVVAAGADGTALAMNCAYITTAGLTATQTISKADASNAIIDFVSKLPDEYVVVEGINMTEVEKVISNAEGKTYLSYMANVSGYNRLDEYNAYDVFVDAVGGDGIGVVATSSFENEEAHSMQETEESYMFQMATVNGKFDWNDEKRTSATEKILISDIESGNSSAYITSVKNATDKAYRFFDSKLSWKGLDGNGTPFKVYVNSNEYVSDKIPTGNALYTNGKIMFFREDLTQGEVDYNTVVHEYAHGVMQNIAGIKGTKQLNENAVIAEGLADVFGEIAEIYQNGSADWIHGERNLAIPSNGYFIATSGNVNVTDLKSCYAYSTVVSHMASFSSGYISNTDLLAEYWFKAMCLMTQHTDFSEFYQILNCLAVSMYDQGKIDENTSMALITGIEMMGLSEQGMSGEYAE